MRVLILSPCPEKIGPTLADAGDSFSSTIESISVDFLRSSAVDFVLSYGYRHILRPDVLGELDGRNCNLHISLLPWNRGADPNLWSWVDRSPKGVTIHEMDAGIDTGPIFCQRAVKFCGAETLATSYEQLQTEIVALFRESWLGIRDGSLRAKRQPVGGSYHRSRDKDRLWKRLPLGYNTPVAEIERL